MLYWAGIYDKLKKLLVHVYVKKKKRKESVTSPEWVFAIWVVRLSWSISIPVCRDNSASPLK